MTNEGKRQDVTERIAKLLRQAEDVVGTPEEAAFQMKAFELIAKYGIDITAVQASRKGLDQPADAIMWEALMKGKYEHAQMLLLTAIARALHCSCLYRTSRIKQIFVQVYGMPYHIERVQMLWDILAPQVKRQVQVVTDPLGGNTMQYRRSYIAGFASAVAERLREQETKAVESAGENALVLYRSDSERAQQYMRQRNPSVTKSKAAAFQAHGYQHGQRDGRSATMQHQVR